MTPQKVREVLKLYEDGVLGGVKPVRIDSGELLDIIDSEHDEDALRKHLAWMCQEAAAFPDEKVEKMMRWLGFIQGCLYSLGSYKLDELKQHNMPDPGRMMYIGLDIETIPSAEALKTDTWKKYAAKHEKEDDYAALHPAFAQIVSVALIARESPASEVKEEVSVCTSMNEATVLKHVDDFINSMTEKDRKDRSLRLRLIGHNIKEFDVPMLSARYVKHGPRVPVVFNTAGRKPWEITWILDTADAVKNGWKMISLDALCLLCGVASSKCDGMDGSKVWEEAKAHNLESIGEYNLDDVRATLECYNVLHSRGLL